jgi:restriction system protein
MNKLWMLRAGEKGFLFDKFIEKSLIAIGWNELGDLSKIRSREELKQLLFAAYGDSGVKSGLYAGILFKFVQEFKKGDKIITYDPINRVYKLGTIISDYYYSEEKIEYFQLRDVSWEFNIHRDVLSEKTKNALGSVLTIFELRDSEKTEIEGLLKKRTEAPPKNWTVK